MSNFREDLGCSGHGGSGSGFHRVQPERDLQSNWEVDLAQKLEEYLLKICSGINPEEDSHIAVNFAEGLASIMNLKGIAALLLQGSIQVYSRKVEYLHSLVLRALEFLSQNRQQDRLEGTSTIPEESGSYIVADDETDIFWCSDYIPVETKNCLDSTSGKDCPLLDFVKPPANLVVLEGNCLDASDGGELESYLLAANDLYQDFILLDPCDSSAVEDYLRDEKEGKGQYGAYRGSSTHKSMRSPARYSGGTRKSSVRKCFDTNINQSPRVDSRFDDRNNNSGLHAPACSNPQNDHCGFDGDDRYSEPGDLDDVDDKDDPWKLFNPHEPGNLKIKPFRKVKAFKKKNANSNMRISVVTLFPVAKLQGSISPEFTETWEIRFPVNERLNTTKSCFSYEKLRDLLVNGGHETGHPDDGNEDNDYGDTASDFGLPDFDTMDNAHVDEDVLVDNKVDEDASDFHKNESLGPDYASPLASLEDLCRFHLDALLASIAETEKQTELAARVSRWKQKIERNLGEQESRPPFDILDYGENILGKLSVEADNRYVKSFSDVVKGKEKYDVARSFSALLQLVNNGDVELDRSFNREAVCYSAENPFSVRLLRIDKQMEKKGLRIPKKRAKSPAWKGSARSLSPQQNSKFSIKLGKVGIRCTPEGKRRRRSRILEPVDLHSAG